VSLEQNTAIAMACYNVARAFACATGGAASGEIIPPLWEDLPFSTKEVLRIVVLRARGGATARSVHKEWMVQKFSEGWIYGEMKNVEKKIHDHLVPYDELPWGVRVSDDLLVGTIKTMVDAFKKGTCG